MTSIRQNKFGFTLIELLVVMSIISLLSSVVLASLNNARTKANLAKIKHSMTQLRNEMAIYYSSNNVYGLDANTSCVGNSANYGFQTITAQRLIAEMRNANPEGNPPHWPNCYVRNNGQDWVVYIYTQPTAPNFYCIDGRGNFKVNATGDWNGTVHVGYCI